MSGECRHDDSTCVIVLICVITLLFSSCSNSCTSVVKDNKERLERIEQKVDEIRDHQKQPQSKEEI